MDPMITIIAPGYNEAGNIQELYKQLSDTLSAYEWQLLFIDDGSTDNSLFILQQLALNDSRVQFISLSRNFGHQQALKAGFDHATGDVIICMDADLQHPVTIIPLMMEKWLEGFEVVNTKRKELATLSWSKRFSSRLFYRIINALSEVHIEQGAADFRLLDRKVINSGALFHG